MRQHRTISHTPHQQSIPNRYHGPTRKGAQKNNMWTDDALTYRVKPQNPQVNFLRALRAAVLTKRA
jgi:hypothetical protein